MTDSALTKNPNPRRRSLERITLVLILLVTLLGQSWSINVPIDGTKALAATASVTSRCTQLLDIDDESRNARALPILLVGLNVDLANSALSAGRSANGSVNFCVNPWSSRKLHTVLLI
jgi:hypothetical protein